MAFPFALAATLGWRKQRQPMPQRRALGCLIALYLTGFAWVMHTFYDHHFPAVDAPSPESEFVHLRQAQLSNHTSVKSRLLSLEVSSGDFLGDLLMPQVCNCRFKPATGGQCRLSCKVKYNKLIVCIRETSECNGADLLNRPELYLERGNHSKPTSYVLVSYESDETRVSTPFRDKERGQVSHAHSSASGPVLDSMCVQYNQLERVPPQPGRHHAVESGKLERLAREFNVKRWFMRNPIATHPLLAKQGVPIGVNGADVVHVATSRRHFAASTRPRANAKLLYLNFALEGSERNCLYQLAKQRGWGSFATMRVFYPDLKLDKKPMGTAEYHYELAQHSFAISPRGYGLDCFRTWEALYLGVIPVLLRRSPAHDAMFDGLPVLFVDSWADVTQSLLVAELERMRRAPYDLNRLRLHTLFQDIQTAF